VIEFSGGCENVSLCVNGCVYANMRVCAWMWRR